MSDFDFSDKDTPLAPFETMRSYRTPRAKQVGPSFSQSRQAKNSASRIKTPQSEIQHLNDVSRQSYSAAASQGSRGPHNNNQSIKTQQDSSIGGSSSITSSPKNGHKIYIPSRIPEEMRIVKPSLARTADEDGFLNPETNIWNTIILPKKYPDSRDDVFILDNWIDTYLQNPRLLRTAVKGSDVESASQIARQQLLVLDLGQSEVVRQVSTHCYERGQLMNKLWSSNKELYETVIKEQQEVIQALHRRVMDGNYHTDQIHQQMELMKRDYDDQIKALYRTSNLGQREEELAAFRAMQMDVIQMERDIKIMEGTVSDLGFWFPNFFSYSTSILRRLLPPVLNTEKAEEDPKDNLPQNKLFEDLKRLERLEMGINILISNDPSDAIGSPKSNREAEADFTAPALQLTSRYADRGQSSNKRERLIVSTSTPMSMRDLVYENQIQNVALKEAETKLKQLEFRSSQREAEMKEKIAILQQQCRNLGDLMQGSVTDDNVGTEPSAIGYSSAGPLIVLSRPFPSLAPVTSIAEELMAFARGLSIHQGGFSESKSMHLVSLAEIQRVFQSFFTRFVTGMLPSNVIGVGSGNDINDARLNHGGRAPHSRLSNTDFCLGSLESLIISQWGMQAKLSNRQTRERLRSLMWSVISWQQSSNHREAGVHKGRSRHSTRCAVSNLSTEDTIVTVHQREELPRYPEEHEISFLRVLSMLLGIRYHRPLPLSLPPDGLSTVVESSNSIDIPPDTTEVDNIDEDSEIPNNNETLEPSETTGSDILQSSAEPILKKLSGPRYPLRDQIFSQIFIRCFQTVQMYVQYNSSMGAGYVAAAALLEKAAPCPIPIDQISKLVHRIIRTPTRPHFIYKSVAIDTLDTASEVTVDTALNEDSLLSSLDAESARKAKSKEIQRFIEIRKSQPWWCQMPTHRIEKIILDANTSSFKSAGISCDVFDLIGIIYDNVSEYYDNLIVVLQELFKFADSVSGGPSCGTLFHSIVLSALEISDALLGPLRITLPIELATAAAAGTLNSDTFSECIMKSGAMLSGLHIVFDTEGDVVRELSRAIKYLYDILVAFDSLHGTVPPKGVAKNGSHDFPDLGGLLLRCRFCLETPPSPVNKLEKGSQSSGLNELYFCYRSLEFLVSHYCGNKSFNFETVLSLEQDAISYRCFSIFKLRHIFRAWASIVELWKEKNKNGELGEDQLSNSEDEDSENDDQSNSVDQRDEYKA